MSDLKNHNDHRLALEKSWRELLTDVTLLQLRIANALGEYFVDRDGSLDKLYRALNREAAVIAILLKSMHSDALSAEAEAKNAKRAFAEGV